MRFLASKLFSLRSSPSSSDASGSSGKDWIFAFAGYRPSVECSKSEKRIRAVQSSVPEVDIRQKQELPSRPTPQSGFTIIETLLAVVILSSALLLLTNSWSSSFMRVRKTQTNFEVAALLERKMSELELQYRGKPLTEILDEEAGDFGSDGNLKAFKWKMESSQLEIPDVSASLSAAQGGGETDPFMVSLVKQLTEGLSKAIKEMKVTIVYTPPKGKVQEFSATMYFVNYDQDLALGMPQ